MGSLSCWFQIWFLCFPAELSKVYQNIFSFSQKYAASRENLENTAEKAGKKRETSSKCEWDSLHYWLQPRARWILIELAKLNLASVSPSLKPAIRHILSRFAKDRVMQRSFGPPRRKGWLKWVFQALIRKSSSSSITIHLDVGWNQ